MRISFSFKGYIKNIAETESMSKPGVYIVQEVGGGGGEKFIHF